MKTITADQIYESEGKERVRNHIIEKLKDTTNPSIFELYGQGLMHQRVKEETNAKIVSIDKDPKIAKIMANNPDTYFGDIQTYCKEKENREKFNTIFLDYCGLFVNGPREDLKSIPKIMANKGSLFITLQHGRECYIEKGSKREDIERFHDYTIKDLLASKNIIATQVSTILYPSIPKYIGKQKRKKKGPTMMKVYEYTWKRVEKSQTKTILRFNNRVITLASNLPA